MLRVGRSGVRIAAGKRLSSSPKRPGRLWDRPTLLFNGNRGSFPGVKRPGNDVDHSTSASTEVKCKWGYTSTPPTCLHGVYKENFTFTFT